MSAELVADVTTVRTTRKITVRFKDDPPTFNLYGNSGKVVAWTHWECVLFDDTPLDRASIRALGFDVLKSGGRGKVRRERNFFSSDSVPAEVMTAFRLAVLP